MSLISQPITFICSHLRDLVVGCILVGFGMFLGTYAMFEASFIYNEFVNTDHIHSPKNKPYVKLHENGAQSYYFGSRRISEREFIWYDLHGPFFMAVVVIACLILAYPFLILTRKNKKPKDASSKISKSEKEQQKTISPPSGQTAGAVFIMSAALWNLMFVFSQMYFPESIRPVRPKYIEYDETDAKTYVMNGTTGTLLEYVMYDYYVPLAITFIWFSALLIRYISACKKANL